MTDRPTPRPFGVIRAIFEKELMDTLRDRRTLAMMVLIPAGLYPLMVLVATETATVEARRVEARRSVVVAERALPPPLVAAIEARSDTIELRPPFAAAHDRSASREELRERLRADRIDLILCASATATEALSGEGTARIVAYYDRSSDFGPTAVDRVDEVIAELAGRLRKERLAGRGVPESLARPIRWEVEALSTASDLGGKIAALYLPLLILFFVTLTTFYPAVDLTAGEKERGTLATLLVAPIDPRQIVVGKYLAVVAIGAIAALINVAIVTATLLRILASSTDGAVIGLPAFGADAIAGLLGASLLLVLVESALMLSAASLARSFRDANSLMTPVMLLVLVPSSVACLAPSVSLTAAWAAVPFVNCVLLMKSFLLGNVLVAPALVAVLASLATAAGFLALASRIFSDERALFAEQGRRANFRSVLLSAPSFGPSTALAFAAWLFIGNYYGGLWIDRGPPLLGVVLLQLCVQLGPALLLARWLRPRVSPGILLRTSATEARVGLGRGLVGGVLIGAGAWLGLGLPILWLQAWLLPEPQVTDQALRAALGLDTLPLAGLVLGVAVLPALAEELAFRGVILSLLESRLSRFWAIVGSALLFGLLHGSVFRMLPTFTLGLVLGAVALRTRSIWPGMAAHALSNAAVIAIERLAPELIQSRLTTPSPWALLGLLPLAAGWALLTRRGLTGSEHDS